MELPQHGRRVQRTGRNCFDVLRTPKYNKPLGKVKEYLKPGGSLHGRRGRGYFSAFSRADSRDLYREAVFSCKTPFWIALSSADTVSR
jgi:hypothetical protein